MTTSTSDKEPAKTDEPATTAASVLEPAAESPVETAQEETADKAKEPNADKNKVKESALDPTKRRLELWNQSTSRKLMIQALPTRSCSITAKHTDHRAQESCFRSDSGEVSRTQFAVPWNPASQMQSSSCARQSRREALMSQWKNAQTSRTA